jgi:hypothetical protein
MPNCRCCQHPNPAHAERCGNCGAWLAQSADEAAAPPAAWTGEPGSAGGGPPAAWAADDELAAAILPLLAQGQKIAAIKVYRARTGAGLRDAKEAVEALAAQRGLASKGSGCGGASTLLFAVALAAIWLAWRCA